MPVPYKEESEKEYIGRCMGDPEIVKKHPDPDNRYMVCKGIYKTENRRVNP